MSVYGRAVDLAVRRLPESTDGQRDDIAATLRSLEDEAPWSRWPELAGIVWLGVRLRSRTDTGDVVEHALRQGLHRGGTLLVAMGAADGGSPAAVAAFVLATWLAARGRVLLALAPVGAGLAAAVTVLGGDAAVPIVLRCLVAVAALCVATAPASDVASTCAWRWLLAAVTAAVLGAVVGGALAVTVLTLSLSLSWLVSARADPRLAVGAAVVLVWRLVAIDVHELVDGTVALATGPDLELVVVRWSAMVAGVAAAVFVARTTLRRATFL